MKSNWETKNLSKIVHLGVPTRPTEVGMVSIRGKNDEHDRSLQNPSQFQKPAWQIVFEAEHFAGFFIDIVPLLVSELKF